MTLSLPGSASPHPRWRRCCSAAVALALGGAVEDEQDVGSSGSISAPQAYGAGRAGSTS
jgi:hypothetical protein